MEHEGLGAREESPTMAASRTSENLADRVQAKTVLLMVVRALPIPPCLPAKKECLPPWVFYRPTCPWMWVEMVCHSMATEPLASC